MNHTGIRKTAPALSALLTRRGAPLVKDPHMKTPHFCKIHTIAKPQPWIAINCEHIMQFKLHNLFVCSSFFVRTFIHLFLLIPTKGNLIVSNAPCLVIFTSGFQRVLTKAYWNTNLGKVGLASPIPMYV